MTHKSPLRLEAERICFMMPEAHTRTLARRLAAEFKVPFEQARDHVRDVRGQKGARTRRYATAPRAKQPMDGRLKMPPSKAEEWLPHELKPGLVGVISDVHIPYHSEKALGVAVDYLRAAKPKTVLVNGDWCDFYAISRWQKDPRRRDFKAEIDACRDGLKWLRSELPSCDIVFKVGNHEDRWNHWLWNHAPEICDFAEVTLEAILKLDELGIDFVTDQRPVMAGKLPIFHGHELPKGLTNPVNMARGAFLRTCHTVLVGHGHRTSGHCESDLWQDEIFCWSTGCLCDMRPDYAKINKWNWGFACVDVAADGSFNVENLRISKNGSVRKS